ncbi:MAG: transposase [Kiritimatiellia bacterium]
MLDGETSQQGQGFYIRNGDTSLGSFHKVRLPRLGQESVNTVWFPRYQRRWQKVDRLILQCPLAGFSPRRTVEIMSRHLHRGLSPGRVDSQGC